MALCKLGHTFVYPCTSVGSHPSLPLCVVLETLDHNIPVHSVVVCTCTTSKATTTKDAGAHPLNVLEHWEGLLCISYTDMVSEHEILKCRSCQRLCHKIA